MAMDEMSESERKLLLYIEDFKEDEKWIKHKFLRDMAYAEIRKRIVENIDDFSIEDFENWVIYFSFRSDSGLIKIKGEELRIRDVELKDLEEADKKGTLEIQGNYSWTNLYRQKKNILKDFEALRRTIKFLFDENVPISDRINEIVNTGTPYHINGLGLAVVTGLLTASNPKKYCVLNMVTEDALRSIQRYNRARGSSKGETYKMVLETQKNLINEYGFEDFIQIDMLMWHVAAESYAVFDGIENEAFEEFGPTPQGAQRLKDILVLIEKELSPLVKDLDSDLSSNISSVYDRGKKEYRKDGWLAYTKSSKLGEKYYNLGQLKVYLYPEGIKIGFSMEKSAKESQRNFKEQLEDNKEHYSSIATQGDYTSGILNTLSISPETISSEKIDEFHEKIVPGREYIFVEKEISKDLNIIAEPGLIKEIYDTFSELYPIYKWTLAESIKLPVVTSDRFKGFSKKTFQFFKELELNNNPKWFGKNKSTYDQFVSSPLRILFEELAENYIISLNIDLETEVNSKKVLGRINRRSPTEKTGSYYPYYWGAFYRQGRTKQTDTQLYIVLDKGGVRVGLSFDQEMQDSFDKFCENTKRHQARFLNILKENNILEHFDIKTEDKDGTELFISKIENTEQLDSLTSYHNISIRRIYKKSDPIVFSGDLFNKIMEDFRRLYPIYLFTISDNPLEKYEEYLDIFEPSIDIDQELIKITMDDLIQETYLTEEFYSDLENILIKKRQVILYGPPGTGKTFIAENFANYFTQNPHNIKRVQFHPSYSYEEFIEGIKVESKNNQITYPIKDGIFVEFCNEAKRRKEPYLFIIDEINRGNIPKIFGELMYLLEYRGKKIILPYSKREFSIPENVFVIGTMNTADRSIALVDFALRRRFGFMYFPATQEVLEQWLSENQPGIKKKVLYYYKTINEAIEDEDFRIGHSYFMDPDLNEERFQRIWKFDIEPYLKEYWFNDPQKVSNYTYDTLNQNFDRKQDRPEGEITDEEHSSL